MTPDTFDDLPTKETSQKVYDNLDLMRGVEVFLNFISAASLEAILRARQNRVTKSNQVLIFDQLLDSTPLFLTGNTDTVYGRSIGGDPFFSLPQWGRYRLVADSDDPGQGFQLKAATIPIEGGQYWPVGTFMGSQRW